MATKEEKFDQVSDEELFSGEPATETAEAEPEAEEAKSSEGRQRDDKGRFAKSEEEPTEEVEPDEEAEPEVEEEAEPVEEPKEEQPDHRVPLMELLNEREKRQNEQRQREALQQQLWQLQQQLQQKQEPEEPIDIFANPEAYQSTVEQRITNMRREMEGNFSLRLARATHKELFDEAWSEMVNRSQMGDDSMRQQVLNSSDPGETLVALYSQAKTYREVNGDPNAWLEAKKAEWLKDPEVQAAILAQARETATQSPSQKPNVKLPPSLNKATASGNALDKLDASDAGMWDQTR